MSVRKNWAEFFLVGILSLVLASSTYAETIETVSAGDGHYTDQSGEEYDYFSDNDFSCCANYNASISITVTSFAQFSLSSIASGSRIASATLNLNMSGTAVGVSGYSGYLYHVEDASTADGNASQRLEGTQLIESIGILEFRKYHSIDITDYLQADLDNGYSWCCFSLSPDTSGGKTICNFFSSDYPYDVTPYISYTLATPGTSDVPEPATLGLLVLGGLGLVWRRRRSA